MKSQSAIEYLVTYSWAFLIVTFAVAAVAIFVFNPTGGITTFTPSYCYIEPGLPCYEFLMMSAQGSSRAVLVFSNNLNVKLYFSTNSIKVKPSSFNPATFEGQCLPTTAPPGALVICNATTTPFNASAGTQLTPAFTLSYQVCDPNCGATQYNTSGTATTVASRFVNLIDRITLSTNPASANIVLNGVSYPNNAVLNVVYGLNYSIFGKPPSLYAFNAWSSTGSISISNTVLQSTSAVFTGNGVLTAAFTLSSP